MGVSDLGHTSRASLTLDTLTGGSCKASLFNHIESVGKSVHDVWGIVESGHDAWGIGESGHDAWGIGESGHDAWGIGESGHDARGIEESDPN